MSQVVEIVALRYPGEIVLRASTETWKELRRHIEQMRQEEKGELSFLIRDGGPEPKHQPPALNTLVLRQSTGELRQFQSGSTLVIEGSSDSLGMLAENIDCPNPFEGAHYHSDSWMPGVSQNSVALVFMHVVSSHAL